MKYIFFHFTRWIKSHIHHKKLNILCLFKNTSCKKVSILSLKLNFVTLFRITRTSYDKLWFAWVQTCLDSGERSVTSCLCLAQTEKPIYTLIIFHESCLIFVILQRRARRLQKEQPVMPLQIHLVQQMLLHHQKHKRQKPQHQHQWYVCLEHVI